MLVSNCVALLLNLLPLYRGFPIFRTTQDEVDEISSGRKEAKTKPKNESMP